jgi:hypothetical protein
MLLSFFVSCSKYDPQSYKWLFGYRGHNSSPVVPIWVRKFKSNILSPNYSRPVIIIVSLSYTPPRNFESLPSIFPTKTIYEFLFSLLYATHPAHHILSDKIYRGAKIMQFLATEFLPSPTYCIPITNECIVRSDKLSTLTLYAFFNVRDKFLRPQKRRGTITLLSV